MTVQTTLLLHKGLVKIISTCARTQDLLERRASFGKRFPKSGKVPICQPFDSPRFDDNILNQNRNPEGLA